MNRRAVVCVCLLLVVFALVGCSSKGPGTPLGPTPEPTSTAPGAAGGTRIANGLYDMPDGTVQAVGMLAHSDLEGGFWQVVFDVETGKTIVVIANSADFESQLKALEGKLVSVKGTRLDGVSTRNAGPEMKMSSIEEMTDTGGPAE